MAHTIYMARTDLGDYIGCTSNLNRRKSEHRRDGKSPLFGVQIHEWRVLALIHNRDLASEMEKACVAKFDTFKSGLNGTVGGLGFQCGKDNINFGAAIHTEEIRRKMSRNRKGKPANRPGWGHSKGSREKVAASKGSKMFDVFHKESGKFVGSWINKVQCCEELGLKSNHIGDCLRGKRKSSYGFIFKESCSNG
jgi:predicted GIY-YIG superfamily endonuclease